MKYDKIKTPIEVEEWITEHGYQQPYGATARQLIDSFGIAEDTWYDWRKKTEVSEAIKDGKEAFRRKFVRKIEDSLAYKATAHTIEAGKRKIYKLDKNGQPQLVQMVVDEKHVEPDMEAIKEILHNIDPEHWKQKQTTELITPNGASITFVSSDKTAEDLKKAAEMFRRATTEEASEEEETNGDRGNESV